MIKNFSLIFILSCFLISIFLQSHATVVMLKLKELSQIVFLLPSMFHGHYAFIAAKYVMFHSFKKKRLIYLFLERERV